MFLEQFVLRFLKLEAVDVAVVAKTDDVLSFEAKEDAMSVLSEMVEFLNTLLSDKDGEFVVSFNMGNECLDLAFVEGEC